MLPKLEKWIRNLESGAHYPLKLSSKDKIFFVSDSKLRRVKAQLKQCDGRISRIKTLDKKGGKSSSEFFKKELLEKVSNYRSPIVLVWFGTCEFTHKKDKEKYIYANEDLDANLDRLKDRYARLKSKILHRNNKAKVIFLDVPYLSITHYNAKLGHDDLSEFDGKSDLVNNYIDSLNEFTSSLNEPYRSPRLSQDTVQCSKNRGQRARYRRNFSAYADGVHPDITLSRLWALRILKLISEVSQTGNQTDSSD